MNANSLDLDREEHFIGQFGDRPALGFDVQKDLKKGNFHFIRPAEGSIEPIWMAEAMDDRQLDKRLPNFEMIYVQWYSPTGRFTNQTRLY